ncbi:MAG: hypothetical protein K6L76_03890 [Agarilytica sp.]
MNDIVIENVELTSVAPAEADETSIPEKSDRRINFSLRQENKIRRKKHLTYLFDNCFLAHKRSGSKRPELISDIRFLDEEFESNLNISWKIISMGLVLFSCSLLVETYGNLSLLSFIGLVAISAIFLILGIFNSTYRLNIHTKNGQLKVAELFFNLPNKVEFHEFCDNLKRAIQKAQKKLPDGNKKYALEMTEHRRIFESGAIKEADYINAKENIMKCFKG